MPATPSITILHLSDLHFGRKHRFDLEGLGSLLERLRQDLDERIARDNLRPDLVVLSGDFAEYGKREEFEQASRFACALRAHLSLPARRFVLVPGNHDINWNKSRAYFEDREGDGLPAVEPYFPKLVHYQRFFEAFYAGEDGLTFTEEEPWSLFEMPDLGVVVAGLDSAFAESHRDGDHIAFLGERQLRAFAGKLKPYKERGFLRIGVMHHDPFDKRGGARVDQDQRDLRRLLVPELNLVLHGDIHEETLRQLDRDVPALGVGSAAVGVDERGPDIANEYQLLVVRADGIERHLRAYVSDQKRWVASPRADSGGESGKTFVRADFDAVAALGHRDVPAPAVDLAMLVARYRASMARNQGAPTVFDLLGVTDPTEGTGGLDFLRLFVPQDAARDIARPERGQSRDAWMSRFEEGSNEVPDDERAMPPARAFDEGMFERTRSVDELFDQRCLLFIGAPGAGKSALTRWLLLKLCVPGERVEGLPDDLVPVRIELRRFDEEHRRAGAGYTFFDHFAREQADRNEPLTSAHLRSLAEAGRVLWLFDGLDEVAEPQRRREMAERIAGLLDGHENCRAVVTSRIAGVEVARPLLEGAAFQTYAIQDFTAEQRDRFLNTWHVQMFARDPGTGTQRRARMASAIEAAPSLQELCKSPLLCALLAYLHREESLPRRRHQLYQKVLERMAEHWDANKNLPARPSVERFELGDKLAFLRALAWQMQSEERTAGNAIGRTALEDFATRFCEQRWGQPRDAAWRRATALIEQLYARNGVLTYLGGDTYGFAHRAFLEHLAASEAVERFRGRQWELADLVTVFRARWQDAGWEETLLLLCGMVQEDVDGPSRVVRLLQGIGDGRLAEVYGQLDEYLAFCIKALGELPQLETGAPGEFARAINDLIVIEIDEDALSTASFTSAFRRCAGRWPEVPRLVGAMVEHVRNEPNSSHLLELYETWIAAGGRESRTPLLKEALAEEDVFPFGLCLEAARLGPWGNDEVDIVLNACRHRDEQDQFNVAASLAATAGMHWSTEAWPIVLLRKLANEAGTEDLRIRSSWMLLRAKCHVDEAREVLLRWVHAGNQRAARQAALCLVDEGMGEVILEALGRFAQIDDDAFVELAQLAVRLPRAGVLLREALAAIRGSEDPDVLLLAASSSMRRRWHFFQEDEILDRWRRIGNARDKLGRIGWFQFIPGPERMVLRAWLELLGQDSKHASILARRSRGMTPERAGPLLFNLWDRLLDVGDWRVSIPLAVRIGRFHLPSKLRNRAEQVLKVALDESAPEQVQLLAARNLGISDPNGMRVQEALAKTAQNEQVRLTAAQFAGDIKSLYNLAARTKNDQRRTNVQHILDIYGHIDFLLRVGKPRRARVRLDGRDAGILEEPTRMGNGTRFQYDATYDGPPIAPNMPLGRIYEDPETLLPFFANLLPEGILYEQTARRLGLKRADRFGMLLRLGADTMGAIEVLPLEPA